jgi:acetyltransferase-like isoleucine patch superfamily enzyme
VAEGAVQSDASRVPTPAEPQQRGALALLRFMARNRMLTPKYARLFFRLARRRWLTPTGRRLKLDGIAFIGPQVRLQIGKQASVRLGRWSWIGRGTKIRCHEGEVRIGAKTVMGEECTISAYQHVSIGEQCIVADRVMLIDFDHAVTEVERPIRVQGIYKRDVRVGNNVWIGYGAQILRGVTVGDNSIIGASAVVSRDVPANAVVAGIPARIVRMRETPETLRWDEPVEP